MSKLTNHEWLDIGTVWLTEAEANCDDITDARVLEVLAEIPKGTPGLSESREHDFVWRDSDGIPRGYLGLWPEGTIGDTNTPVFSFMVYVHPEWRRKGIATALFRLASETTCLYDEEWTPAGAAWARTLA